MIEYFKKNFELLEDAIESIDEFTYNQLLEDCFETLKAGNKIIASGLGKNVPICEKFVGASCIL